MVATLTSCVIVCLLNVLRYDAILQRSWVEFGDHLETRSDLMLSLKRRFNTDNLSVRDLLQELINNWVTSKGSRANIHELRKILANMNAMDAMEKIANCETSCSTLNSPAISTTSDPEKSLLGQTDATYLVWITTATLGLFVAYTLFHYFPRNRRLIRTTLNADSADSESSKDEVDFVKNQVDFPNPVCPEEKFFEFDASTHPEYEDRAPYFRGERLRVKVKMAEKPYNGQHPDPNKFYKMTSKPRGVALIINNRFKGEGESERFGSEFDVYYMGHLFSQMGFATWVAQNVKSTGIQSLFGRYRAMLTKDMNCSVVVIMTHGEFNKVWMADHKLVHIYKHLMPEVSNDKWQQLGNGFENKPKLFIFNACQIFSEQTDSDKIKEYNHVRICYPSLPGDVARRQEQTGSRYIYHLAKVFMDMAHEKDIDELNTEVADVMSELELEEGFERQIPRCEKIGKRKRLYFNPGCVD